MTATINNRTTLYQGRVFNLVRENVTLDNGVITDMEFVEHPGATAIIPMLNESRIILLKQYRHALRKYIWEIPAGTIDPQESVINCAKRELIEELGDVIDGKPLHEGAEGLGAQGSVLDEASRALDDEAEGESGESESGEGAIEEGYKDSQMKGLKRGDMWACQIHDDSGYKTKWLNIDEEFMKAINNAWKSQKK